MSQLRKQATGKYKNTYVKYYFHGRTGWIDLIKFSKCKGVADNKEILLFNLGELMSAKNMNLKAGLIMGKTEVENQNLNVDGFARKKVKDGLNCNKSQACSKRL